MQEHSLSKKIIRNTFFNIIGQSWAILVSLALTPYIVGKIGIDRYGIWAFVGILTGYFGLLDFGVSTSFVKYISEFYAKKDFEKINQLVNTGFVFYSAFAIFIIILGFFLINRILAFFKIPLCLYNEAISVFLLGIIIFGISNALSSFRAIQFGLQRMDVANKVSIVLTVPMAIGTISFLNLGYGLVGLMINNAIVLFIGSLINIIIAFSILPELKFSPRLFTREMFNKIFSYGYKLQIASISSMVSLHIEKLLIGYFLSIGLVSVYQLGSSIVEKTMSLSLLLVTALIPAFSDIDARRESRKLIDGYTRSTRYLALFVVPLFTFIIISADQIMMVWMGYGYERSASVIKILGIGWSFAILSSIRTVMVQALAKTEIEMGAGLVAAILNIPLSIIFISKFGFLGAALGTSIALIFSVIYGFGKLHENIKLPILHFVKETILETIIICICVGLFVWGLTTLFSNILLLTGRFMSFLVFILKALLFFGIYLKVLSYIKPLDNIDFGILFKDRHPFIRSLLQRFCHEV